MNHRPFEDWLLDDQPLTPQQQRDLQAHVRSCPACAAIAESNLALHATRLVSPAAGFADRFQVRLAKRRREQRWRQVIGEAGSILLSVLPTFISPAGWIILTAGVAGLGYLWTISIRRVARAPQGV